MLKSKLTMAIVLAMALGQSQVYAATLSPETGGSQAQDDQASDANSGKVKKLDAVTVTGSLIPQAAIETATPTITITADEIKSRGFTTVADAL